MTTKELKEKYLKFFETKGHKIIPNASLIPENDPTALFISAGMHPLVPYILGEKHPAGDKLANNQKCIRTNDIEEVGDAAHLTFFEMLGNWSLGDYWKEDAIKWSFEFLTKELRIPIERLAVSCFKGEEGIPKDEESAKIWQSLGIPKERIYFFGKKDNWWGPAGKTGPCGPDTEMFYWVGKGKPGPLIDSSSKGDWIEIWNDVFIQYNKTTKGKYEPLKQKTVDTGMGMERTAAILSGKKSVFDIEPLKSIVEKVRELAFKQDAKAERIIADHLRAASFILAEEVVPSKLERGYVLRRLIRRAITQGKEVGIDKPFAHHVAEVVIKKMGDEYPELKKNEDFIIEQLVREEERYSKITTSTSKAVSKSLSSKGYISTTTTPPQIMPSDEEIGEELFDLNTTHGMPLMLVVEDLEKRGIKVSEKAKKVYEKKMKEHQELSRTATAGKFKSGLADHSEEVTKLHTATHLLLASLRQVLGKHVVQKGSNITAERLRLDFSHSEKLTTEQLKKVEDIVNQKIKDDLPVIVEEKTLKEARKEGAVGVFEGLTLSRVSPGDKTPDIGDSMVKVYLINDFSKEMCAGPHVKSTGELGHFRIKKEESSSAGVRRIKAVLE